MGLALAAAFVDSWFPEGITPGNVLTMLTLTIAAIAAVVTMKNTIQSNRELVDMRLETHEKLLSAMNEEMGKLAVLITNQAVAEQRALAEGRRVDEVERRLTELERENRRLRQ